MNDRSRTRNTVRNFFVGFGGQLFQYSLSFATRTIFIMLLSVEYLGVSGLFTNILEVLSLAEMGVGGVFVSLLYKPLHDNDSQKLASLMKAYKKAYMLIGGVVAVAGMAVFPFLDLLIKEKDIANIPLIYLMFLAGSVATYFFKYKIDLLIADQKLYINTIYTQVFIFIQYAAQILVLLLTRNFILYLAIQIICPIIGNLFLVARINRMYPFLREKSLPLDRESLADLKRKVMAGVYHLFGYVIANGTDNIIISAFLGVYWVGIYSNYLLIIGVISAFITLTFNSVNASIGNLVASSEGIKSFRVFQNVQYINFMLVGFSAVCFMTLFNPFISLWIGEQYLLDQKIVILIVIMFYIGRMGMQKCINIFKFSSGLFYYDRYFSLIEGLLKLAASIYLIQHWGLAGVFAGTIFSILATKSWIEAYVVFKRLFHQPLYEYFGKYLQYGLATAVTGSIVYFLVMRIPHESWAGFLVMAAACGLLTMGLFVLMFYRTEQFRFFFAFFMDVLKNARQGLGGGRIGTSGR